MPDASARVLCCDLDGVVWRGDTPITGSADGIAQLRAGGWRVAFVTNNSGPRLADHVAHLNEFGIPAHADDVCTSAQAAAALVAANVHAGGTVLTCGGPGVVEALEARGLRVVDRVDAAAVVVGLTREFDFDDLTRTSDAARNGAYFVATNLDATYPVHGGVVPGSGALVAAVATAAGRTPVVAGKPEPPMAELVRARFGASGVVVGDRPSSDGAFAAALGWPFALVLSGVAGSAGGEPVPDPSPPFVADDLATLAPQLLAAGH